MTVFGRQQRLPRRTARERRNAARLGLAGQMGDGLTVNALGQVDLYINGLTVAAIAAGDFVPFWDITATAANKKITFADFEGTLNHDNLAGFVADEHIAHSGVTLTAGIGLSGGGTIAASRTFDLDILGLTTDIIAAGDWVPFHDLTDAANKISFSDFEATLNHDNLAGFVAAEHYDWTNETHAFSTTSTGHFGSDLDTDGNLVVDGLQAIGTIISSGTGFRLLKIFNIDNGGMSGVDVWCRNTADVAVFGEASIQNRFIVEQTGDITNMGGSVYLYGVVGYAQFTGEINDATSALTIKGLDYRADFTGTNTNCSSITVTGARILSAGNLGVTGSTIHEGMYIGVSGTADENVGLRINSVTGATSNYAVWDASGADWILASDIQKIIFGVAYNASIYYDGADLIIDPKEVGTGVVNLNGGGLTTTGLGTFGSLSVDSPTLVVNLPSYLNRVGIGTATPGYTLDVGGGATNIACFRGRVFCGAGTPDFTGEFNLSRDSTAYFQMSASTAGGGASFAHTGIGNLFFQSVGGIQMAPTNTFSVYHGGVASLLILNDRHIRIPGDSKYLYFGGEYDVRMTYDGTNFWIQPDAVGTGYVQIFTQQPLAFVIGRGTVGVDYQLKFDGETNDGIITWMEDEADFRFDSTIDIMSTADPQLRLTHTDGVDETDFYTNSDGELEIMPTARTIYLGDGTAGDATFGFYGSASVFTFIHDDSEGTLNLSANDVTNYTQFAADGIQSMHGTARVERHLWVGASALHPQGATEGVGGRFPHLIFANNVDDDAYYSTHVPYRRADNTDIKVTLFWYYTGGNDNTTCEWNLSYSSVAIGEDPTGAGTALGEVATAIATDDTIGTTEFTVPAAALVNHDNLGLYIWRDGSDALGTNALLIGFHITFIMDKLGLAT